MLLPLNSQAPEIQAFCGNLVPGGRPIQLRCEPDRSASALDCIATVDHRVHIDGGKRMLGWMIVAIPNVWIEAQFHAVWSRPSDDALIDIARHQFPWSFINFLADPSRNYEGRQVENVQEPLGSDPRIRRCIELKQRCFQILNSGERASQRKMRFPGAETDEYERLQQEITALEQVIMFDMLK